ncbi:MAG TPA: hypothetical protein VMT22_04470 [Terriglobales bacterium]|nr:hypothetical protein [Terriglobales bacterium]
MIVPFAGLTLVVVAGIAVWYVSSRIWHVFAIGALSLLLFPLVAIRLTGDLSRYFPAGTFSDGAAGKDEVVLASATATILIAIILAACIWGAASQLWRYAQQRMGK